MKWKELKATREMRKWKCYRTRCVFLFLSDEWWCLPVHDSIGLSLFSIEHPRDVCTIFCVYSAPASSLYYQPFEFQPSDNFNFILNLRRTQFSPDVKLKTFPTENFLRPMFCVQTSFSNQQENHQSSTKAKKKMRRWRGWLCVGGKTNFLMI